MFRKSYHFKKGKWSKGRANYWNKKGAGKLKFDAVVGNPPYQENTGDTTSQATPVYNLFVNQAKKLNPRYLVMITPSRWFAGGMGLSKFRKKMLDDTSIKKMIDYTNAKDCFPGISISGGVNYFLRDINYSGPCNYTNIHDGIKSTRKRVLSENEVFIRYNEGYDIVKKVKSLGEQTMESLVSSLSPFGLNSSERGSKTKNKESLVLYSSSGKSYISIKKIDRGIEYIDKYKILMSKTTSEHAGEPDKDGKFKVTSKMQILEPNEVCTFSYFLIGCEDDKNIILNMYNYLSTKFVRFLLLQAITSINISKEKFLFIPQQDFNKQWTDDMLYKKYGLNADEIAFIEARIKPME